MKKNNQTLILKADNAQQLATIAEFEKELSRQVGYPVVLGRYVDDKGKKWACAGWPMSRQEQAAVAMYVRRGKTPQAPPIIKNSDVEKKSKATVIAEKKLTPTTASVQGGGGIDPKPKGT